MHRDFDENDPSFEKIKRNKQVKEKQSLIPLVKKRKRSRNKRNYIKSREKEG